METAAEILVTVKINRATWRRLTQLKESPSDTYDDVIQRLLDEREGAEHPQERDTA